MKTKINNEEFKDYGDGKIAFKMLSKGVHYVLRFYKTETMYGCEIRDDWFDLCDALADKSIFGLFNKICKFFGCTLVKFQETLPIVDEALNK